MRVRQMRVTVPVVSVQLAKKSVTAQLPGRDAFYSSWGAVYRSYFMQVWSWRIAWSMAPIASTRWPPKSCAA